MPQLVQVGRLMGAGRRGGAPAPSMLPLYKAAQALRAAGTRNVKIAMVGDSTTAGWGSQNSAGHVNDASLSTPRKLADLLSAVNGSWQSQFADYNTLIGGGGPISLPTFESRVILGSWNQTISSGTAAWTVAGPMLRCTAGLTAKTFQPTTSTIAAFDYYYIVNTTFGTMTAQIDSDLAVPINQAGAQAVVKTTLTAAGGAGSRTLKTARVTGTIFDVGAIAYDPAVKETSVLNLGFSGSTAAMWNNVNGAWDPLLVLAILAPDLTIICLTINDWVANTSSAAFKASTQAIIDKAKLSGDVILMSGAPSAAAGATLVNQAAKIADYDALAATNGIIHINQTTLFTSWIAANAASQTFDNLHYRAAANDITAAAIKAVLDANA